MQSLEQEGWKPNVVPFSCVCKRYANNTCAQKKATGNMPIAFDHYVTI